jgi:hypothetical protein
MVIKIKLMPAKIKLFVIMEVYNRNENKSSLRRVNHKTWEQAEITHLLDIVETFHPTKPAAAGLLFCWSVGRGFIEMMKDRGIGELFLDGFLIDNCQLAGMHQNRSKCNISRQARRPAPTIACRGDSLWSPVSYDIIFLFLMIQGLCKNLQACGKAWLCMMVNVGLILRPKAPAAGLLFCWLIINCQWSMVKEIRRSTDDRRRKTDDREQKTEDRGQRTEDR